MVSRRMAYVILLGGVLIWISLCNLCVLCVSVVKVVDGKHSPQRHRGHRGCTEKKIKLRQYQALLHLDIHIAVSEHAAVSLLFFKPRHRLTVEEYMLPTVISARATLPSEIGRAHV